MRKLVAIAFSDLHLYPFQNFAKTKYDRLAVAFSVWKFIAEQARDLKVPLLFAGDLLHNPKDIENYILDKVIDFCLNTHQSWALPFVGISGNHDLCEKNTQDNLSPSYLKTLSKVLSQFHCVDNSWICPSSDLYVAGVPYMNDDKALIKMIKAQNKQALTQGKKATKVLLLHFDLPNCPTPSGHVVKDVKGIPTMMDTLWDNFDHVLAGHIHRPHVASDLAAMLGSPSHQNAGDVGCDMGYWEIYTDKKVFKPLPQFPMFWKREGLQEWEIDQLQDEGHYVLPYEGGDDKDDELIGSGKFSNKLPVEKLVRRYLKEKGELSKSKRKLLTSLLTEAKQ